MKSDQYALTGPDNIIIIKGSKKDMHRLRKQKGPGYTVWLTRAKIGDTINWIISPQLLRGWGHTRAKISLNF